MAIVTGLTAAKMGEIAGASIVSGSVDAAHHLILTTNSGLEVDAGYVKGDQGDIGPNPLVSIADQFKPSTDAPSTYPIGLSTLQFYNAAGWPTYDALVFTVREPTRGYQTITQMPTGDIWLRTIMAGDVWSPFREVQTDKVSTWEPMTITHSSFEPYVPGEIPLITRNGNRVTMVGSLRGLVEGTVNAGADVMQMPDEKYYPSTAIQPPILPGQASGSNRYGIRMYHDGIVRFERYGPALDGNNTWLPFYVEWLAF